MPGEPIANSIEPSPRDARLRNYKASAMLWTQTELCSIVRSPSGACHARRHSAQTDESDGKDCEDLSLGFQDVFNRWVEKSDSY